MKGSSAESSYALALLHRTAGELQDVVERVAVVIHVEHRGEPTAAAAMPPEQSTQQSA